MKIILAGYNVDAEALEKLRKAAGKDAALEEALSPESLSAAYARISRSPKSVDKLRAESRREIEKMRERNQRIVFEYGHSSIAEHACFNFDVLGVSRLAIEELESARLASYTEKSQRYVRMESDFYVPPQIEGTKLGGEYVEAAQRLGSIYKELAALLEERFPEEKNLANEDARYVLPLCAKTQLGMTVNARTLERSLRKLAGSELDECRELGAALHAEAVKVAPSLFLFTEPPLYENREAARKAAGAAFEILGLGADGGEETPSVNYKTVELLACDKDADKKIAASILFELYGGASYADCLKAVKAMSKKELSAFYKAHFADMTEFSPAWRQFETASFTFEIKLSAAAYGQLKRHRMATIVAQPYDVSIGVTLPYRIVQAKGEKLFYEAVKISEKMYDKTLGVLPSAAPYALLNAHMRRVLFTINAREAYHLARLRCDMHAQWDVRNVSDEIIALAKKAAPFAMSMACGKDAFARTKRK